MKKLLAVLLCMVMVFSMAACGGGGEEGGAEGEVYEITYAGTVADTHTLAVSTREAAEKMAELSDGRIKLTLFPNNQLGDFVSCFNQMQVNGSVQMGEVSSASLTAATDLFTPYSLPFLFTSKEQCFNFFDNSPIIDELEEKFLEETGVRILGYYYNDARALSNSIRPVSKPEDMKGIKVRVMQSDVYIKTFEALGALPVSMSFSELFTALQQGNVDGQDNGSALTVATKFHEVQDYYTDLGHVYDIAPIMVSEEYWQSLPADIQQIIADCMAEAVIEERGDYDVTGAADLEAIGELCEVTLLSEEQRLEFQKACEPVYDWYREAYPQYDLDAILEEVAKY